MKQNKLLVWVFLLILFGLMVFQREVNFRSDGNGFNGYRAYLDVYYQLSLGARIPESQAHAQAIILITEELKRYGWQVNIQESQQLGHSVKNIIAQRGNGNSHYILGAHYDSRQIADKDPNPEKRSMPTPGANDGASGVAVLLELARKLPKDLPLEIWLVFFDAEDQGNISGWEWILGSQSFAERLDNHPNGVVIIDMIGDKDLTIYMEQNSDPTLTAEIWNQAKMLGYSQYFIPEYKYSILDDHIPFVEKGIPAVDVIDFDYPYWHTTSDTVDKVNATSLEIVGKTLINWINSKASIESWQTHKSDVN